jgi:hypothetical protein
LAGCFGHHYKVFGIGGRRFDGIACATKDSLQLGGYETSRGIVALWCSAGGSVEFSGAGGESFDSVIYVFVSRVRRQTFEDLKGLGIRSKFDCAHALSLHPHSRVGKEYIIARSLIVKQWRPEMRLHIHLYKVSLIEAQYMSK